MYMITPVIKVNEFPLPKIPGYDIIRNERSTGQRGDVAFLVKNGLVVNKKYRNDDINIITDNEALAIEL